MLGRKAQRNFTDPYSRIMPGPGGRDFQQSYNCQAVGEAPNVAARATNQSLELEPAALVGSGPGRLFARWTATVNPLPVIRIVPLAVWMTRLRGFSRSGVKNSCRRE